MEHKKVLSADYGEPTGCSCGYRVSSMENIPDAHEKIDRHIWSEHMKDTVADLRAENEALLLAGRGLFEAYKSLCLEDGRASMRFDAIDAWDKVDPQ